MRLPAPLRVAQITDTHLFAVADHEFLGCQTVRSFQIVVAQIQQLQSLPDLLLLTGDLSQDETIASYRHLQQILSPLNLPTYWIPGNHDQTLPTLEEILSTPPFSPQKCFQRGGWNFILLDSMLPQQVQGRLSGATLDWLAQQLQADLPTLISLHHPPLPIGSRWMDQIGLENPEDFFAVIGRHPQVKLVVFGHIHQTFQAERQGVHYLGAPSSCVQFKPHSADFALDVQPPGFRLFTLYADGRYETSVERVR